MATTACERDDALVASDVWLITGAQASGKSTVAELLARTFDPSAHVRGGQFYRWAVNGWRHFDDPDHPAARTMLALRYRLSAMVANEYAAAGFTAVVQDNIYGTDVVDWAAAITGACHVVVLRPTVATLTARDAHRQRLTGKTAYRHGYTPADNDRALAETPPHLGLWLDTSGQRPDDTVREILARRHEAQVSPP